MCHFLAPLTTLCDGLPPCPYPFTLPESEGRPGNDLQNKPFHKRSYDSFFVTFRFSSEKQDNP